MDGIVRRVCERFGLGEPVSIEPAGGTRNLTFMVNTLHGKWAIRRRYHGYCDPERLAFDHNAAHWLAERGACAIPPRRTSDGDSFLIDEGDIWEAYPLADGRHLRDGDAGDCAALGDSLAQFHHAGESFSGRYDKLGPRGETDPAHLFRSIEKARADAPDAAGALDEHSQAVAEAASELLDDAWATLPHTLVHGDVQPANIIMVDPYAWRSARPETKPCVAAFLDLDWLAWRPRIYDLCFAILCCCTGHDRPLADGDVWAISQTPVPRPQPIRAFLDAYGPLDDPEKPALKPQLSLTWCHIRVDNSLKLPPRDRRAFLERGIDHGWQDELDAALNDYL